jgi:hypothetical protein
MDTLPLHPGQMYERSLLMLQQFEFSLLEQVPCERKVFDFKQNGGALGRTVGPSKFANLGLTVNVDSSGN